MRLAPAVSVTASNAGAWRWLQVLLLALSGGVGAAWLGLQLSESAAWAAPVGAFVVGGLAWRLVPARPVLLRWTGEGWQMSVGTGGPAVDLQAVEVAMDLGTAVLLRLRPSAWPAVPALHHWVVVTRAEAGPDFRALCVALYAPSLRDGSAARHVDGPLVG